MTGSGLVRVVSRATALGASVLVLGAPRSPESGGAIRAACEHLPPPVTPHIAPCDRLQLSRNHDWRTCALKVALKTEVPAPAWARS
jgi:hypothetical protein